MTHQELDTQFDERLARESDPKEASPQKYDVKETMTPRSLQFKFKCVACGRETGSSLPHQLVHYLVREQGFDLLINDA